MTPPPQPCQLADGTAIVTTVQNVRTSHQLDPVLVIIGKKELRSLPNIPQMSLAVYPVVDAQNAVPPAQRRAVALGHYVGVLLHRENLGALGGTSARIISPSDLDSTLPSTKPARKGVKTACVNCRSAAKRCDAGRPCSRCIKLGLEESCVDAPTKRRKPIHEGTSTVVGLALDQPQMAASNSTKMDLVSQFASATGTLSMAMHTSPQLWDLPAAPFTDAQGSRGPGAYADPPIFELGVMGDMPYTYTDGNTTQGLNPYLQAMGPINTLPTGNHSSTYSYAMDPQVVPHQFEFNVASGSRTGEGPSGTQPGGFDPYPSPWNPDPGSSFYWGHQNK